MQVEFGIEANNRVCNDEPLTTLQDNVPVPSCFNNKSACDPNQTPLDNVQCLQRKLPDSDQANSCEILPPTKTRIKFQTGRVDCEHAGVAAGSTSHLWDTSTPESSPGVTMNGQQTVEWMKENFGFNAQETVAIMGAHTLGKFNKRQTMLKYTWTSREEHSFNNQYYRNLMSKDDWHVDDNICTPVGTAYHKRPHGKFMARMKQMTHNGGPVQWVQYKHTCPNCASLENLLDPDTGAWGNWDADQKALVRSCCENLPDDDNDGLPDVACHPDNNRSPDSDSVAADDDEYGGCEQWRIIRGREATMLSTDMGLYLDFDVQEDGKPTGCNGLGRFTEEYLDLQEASPQRNGYSEINGSWQSHIGYTPDGVPKWGQECPLNEWKEDGGSKLHELVEMYADDETEWIKDFFGAMEKMLANGYPGTLTNGEEAGDLVDSEDHWKVNEVTCSWPMVIDGSHAKRQVTCSDSRSGTTATSGSTFAPQ